MADLRDLYQEVILDHNKNPRNFGSLSDANRCARGSNPLCGDEISLSLKVVDGVIDDVSFEGVGCAISTSSASLMTERVKGKSQGEVEKLFGHVHSLMTGESAEEVASSKNLLGKLIVFEGVQEYPIRVKCATLAWHTLKAAMAKSPQTVSTE